MLGFAALAAPTCLSLAQQQWSRDSGAHGPIVLAMGGWLLWRAWPDLAKARRPGNPLVTAALLAFALPIYVFGRAFDFLTLEAAGAYVAGFAVLQSRFGLRTLWQAWFPILYLGSAIPPPQSLLDSATAPLKTLVSYLATTGLSAAGLPVARQGVTIFVDQYQLLVEDACSGLNSIIGLTAITLLYVYLVRGTGWVRPLVLCATSPARGDPGERSPNRRAGAGHLRIRRRCRSERRPLHHRHRSLRRRVGADVWARSGPGALVQSREAPLSRRGFLGGSRCLAAAGAAYALSPRRHVSLLGSLKLADITPGTVGAWLSEDVKDLAALARPGTLMAQLYEDVLQRVYRREGDQTEIMVLLAHGDTQTNDLQLHRPEECYQPFCFTIASDAVFELPLAAHVALPARRLVAEAPGRRETIVYWARLGEFFPADASQQRVDRLRTAVAGIVADGLLARFSIVSDQPESALAQLCSFIPSFVRSVAPAHRDVFVGSNLTAELASADERSVVEPRRS